jgi:hypothetical protein
MRYKLLGQHSGLPAAGAVPLGFRHDMLAKASLRNRLAGGKFDLFDQPTQLVR